MSLVQVQVYLDEGLAARLVEAAREADRSLSREAARRLEASFGAAEEPWKPAPLTAARKALLAAPAEALEGTWLLSAAQALLKESEATPVASTPLPKKDPLPLAEERAVVVEHLQQQVPAVRPASAFPSVPQDLARQVTPRPRGGS